MSRPAPYALAVAAALAVAVKAVPAAARSPGPAGPEKNDAGWLALDETSVRLAQVGPDSPGAALSPVLRVPLELLPGPLEIVNLGSKVWEIVESNKPALDVKTAYATALPRAVDWRRMAGWQPPTGAVYRLTAENIYGVRVVDVTFRVQREYGGSYNGKGRYLTAITVQPLNVKVLWGYAFSMSAAVPDSGIVNVGLDAEDPIAGATLRLDWSIRTSLVAMEGGESYYMQGDGYFRDLDASADRRQKAAQRKVDAILAKAIY